MPHIIKLICIFLAASFAAWLPTASAQEDFVPPMPKNPDLVDVYLLTVGRGPQVYALFGHTILRVVDHENKLDMGFNWGIFDFKDPSFVWTFYRGDLDYQLAVSNFSDLVRHYRDFEKRRVVQDKVNLTAAQKIKLYERLIWNARPENLFYKYSQLLDNCSTRPRDLLDTALDGKIQRHFGSRLARVDFRHHIRGGANALWWAYLGLDQLSNSQLDRPISEWEEMFLPQRLREHLRELPAFDDKGRVRSGVSLLSDSRVLIDLPEPRVGSNPYYLLSILIGFPLAFACILWLRRSRTGSFRSQKRIDSFFAVMSIVYGLWSAVWGTLMASNWVFSTYAELQHNAALLLFWPLDWLFVAYGISFFFGSTKLHRPAVMLSGLHLVGLGILVFGYASGLIKQDVLPILASSGLIACVYYLSIRRGRL